MNLKKLGASILEVFSKRKLILELSRADFKKRFVGSYFGLLWMFIQPVVTIFIYYCVFQLALGAVPRDTNYPYVVWLVPGIVPWFYFSEAINHATRCLEDYHYLVKKIVFKVSILPLIKILSCGFVHLIFLVIMFAAVLLLGLTPSIFWIQIFYYSFCMVMLIIGISMFTSAIQVFFRDMSQIVSIVLQLGMWATPIMWEYQRAGKYLWILKLNPMYYIVEGYRDSMIYHKWFFTEPKMTLYFWAFTLIMLFIGCTVFKKCKPHFADVL